MEHQRELQEYWAHHNAACEKGLEDFQKLKSIMDEQLLKRDHSRWKKAIIRFRNDLCVTGTGAVSPNRDLGGKPLQILHDLDSEIQELMFGVVATPDGGAAIFTWQACDSAPNQFVGSLLAKEKRSLPSLVVQFIFAYIENTYFSGDWWTSLSRANREHIENLAAIGDAYYTDFSYSPSVDIVPWEVTDIVVP